MAVTSKKILDANISTCAVAGTAEEVSSFIQAVDRGTSYAINTAGTIVDHAINVVTNGAWTIPAGFNDLLIRFTGTPVSLTFADTGITDYGDDLPSSSGNYLVTITRISANEAYIRIIELTERA